MGCLLGPPDRERWARRLELPVGGRLLDAGGGTGRVSEPLRPLVGQLIVADTSLGMLRHARTTGETIPVRADVALLPFPDASFERVMVADALHHFSRQREAIHELARVLAPGGVLVIEEFDIRRPAVKALALLEKLTLMGSRFPRPEQIRSLLLATGLRAEILEGGGLSVLIVAKK
jgi:demethylmenaquinone methyltransferase/2-methoxy-6-polyprenyl-1,4-benzoquinol methylase